MKINRAEFLKQLGGGLLGTALSGSWSSSLHATEIRRAELVGPALSPQASPSSAVNALRVSTGPGFGRRIALTFDDGPAPHTTPLVLKALRERKLPATFFLIGKNVKQFPNIVRQTLAEGHELANHSYTHPYLSRYSNQRVSSELKQCQEAIHSATGQKPVWFRPPYGAWNNERQGKLAVKEALGVALWSVDPNDWRDRNARIVAQRVLTQTHPGSIVLLHDIHPSTVQAVPEILDGLLEKGYEFTTLSGFLGQPYSTAA